MVCMFTSVKPTLIALQNASGHSVAGAAVGAGAGCHAGGHHEVSLGSEGPAEDDVMNVPTVRKQKMKSAIPPARFGAHGTGFSIA